MKRPLTPEEKKLWEQVASGAVPLLYKRDEKMRGGEDEKRKVQIQAVAKQINLLISSSSHHLIPQGSYTNIDRGTAERFRKGRYPIDATLDLHGLSRDKAQTSLYRFLESHYQRGSRCLLVVTGKGLVLRESLPQWLMGLQQIVLAFDTAKPKDGGSGAFYILLRRKRGKE